MEEALNWEGDKGAEVEEEGGGEVVYTCGCGGESHFTEEWSAMDIVKIHSNEGESFGKRGSDRNHLLKRRRRKDGIGFDVRVGDHIDFFPLRERVNRKERVERFGIPSATNEAIFRIAIET